MLCPNPISIPRPNGRGSADRISVPCGKCAICLESRRREWAIRLKEELKNSVSAIFITLTYENDPSTLIKRDFQLFIKKLRKKLPKFRYYAVGEYGSKTYRPHYHALLFGIDITHSVILGSSWTHGFIQIGDVNEASIMYVAKYHVNKTKYPDGCDPPFALMSIGIGKSYLNKMVKYHGESVNRCYYQNKQFKEKLPRYYKDKIYSAKEKEQIAAIIEEKTNNIIDIERYIKKYPNSNYFKYMQDKIENHKSKYHEKTNFKNSI